jgi:hypothetical protein
LNFIQSLEKRQSRYKNVAILVAHVFIIDLNMFCPENRVNSQRSFRRSCRESCISDNSCLNDDLIQGLVLINTSVHLLVHPPKLGFGHRSRAYKDIILNLLRP